MRRRRTHVVGYYGMRNYGDDLFCRVVELHAKSMFPGSIVTVIDGRSQFSLLPQWIGSKLTRMWSREDLLGGALRFAVGAWSVLVADEIVLAGGSVLSSISGVRRIQGRIASVTRTSFSAIGVSIGPFRTASDAADVTRFLRRCRHIVVRDARSADLLRELGLQGAPVGGDLAALFPFDELRTPEPKAANDRVLGVSVCNYDGASEDVRRLADGIGEALTRVHEAFSVSVFALNAHPVRGDQQLAAQLEAALLERGVTARLERYDRVDVSEMAARLIRMDGIVSARLHGAVTGVLSDVPTAIVEYHRKSSDFAADMGLPPERRVPVPGSVDSYAEAVLSVMAVPLSTAPSGSAARLVGSASTAYLHVASDRT